jgi:hypothetical protein
MVKKTNCRKGFVEVPQMTLNALKGLLFGKEGVDLSSIIKDLAPDENNTELTEINVGLVYKGLTPKVDENPRYEFSYDSLVKFEYVGISLIMGIVKVRRYERDYNHYGNDYSWKEDWRCVSEGVECYGFDQWLEMNTDEKVAMKAIEDKFPKPQPQEPAE